MPHAVVFFRLLRRSTWASTVSMNRHIRLALVAAGIAIAAIGVRTDFATARAYVDQFAGDGSADPYTEKVHSQVFAAIFGIGIATTLISAAAPFIVQLSWTRHFWSKVRSLPTRTRTTRRTIQALTRKNCIPLLTLTAVGAALRLYHIHQPVRHDEAYTWLLFARHPWFVGLSFYDAPNNHVLHTFLAHLSTELFGPSPWALRIPALIAGILCVPATYLAARVQGGRPAGIIAASIVASSSALIEFSTNARGYTLICLFTSTSLFAAQLALHGVRRDVRPGIDWVLLVIATSLGAWANPTMIYPAILIWGWLLITGMTTAPVDRRRSLAIRFSTYAIMTGVLTTAFYSPVFLATGLNSVIRNRFVSPLEWPEFLRRLPGGFHETWSVLARDWAAPIPAIILMGIAVAVLGKQNLNSKQSHRPLLAVLIPCICLPAFVAIQRVIPFARVWLFLLPLSAVIGSIGLCRLIRLLKHTQRTVMLSLLTVMFLVWPVVQQSLNNSIAKSPLTGAFPESREVLQYIQNLANEDSNRDLIVVTGFPVGAPLAYTAVLNDVSLDHFVRPDDDTISNAIVLTDGTDLTTVEAVLNELGISELARRHDFTVIKTFPTVQIHAVTGSPLAGRGAD
jgi:4-amino-4-deoxy-L-arabinose transferase-like glycosyltransferase